MRSLIQNKTGGFTDLFLFMIFAFVIILISVVFIYIGIETENQLQESLGKMDLQDTEGNNASVVIDNTMGVTNTTFSALRWIAVFLIVGMIISIFIGSYLVTTKPIFFIPYLFITIIAIIVSVPMSNTYETLMENPTLAGTFVGFTGANWIMLSLPIWVTIVGIVGGIIMFSRMGKGEEQQYGY
jgi:flagellar biosynthesis protein FliQ|tara:strand:- start:40 stop:591 length:552 start_codon:yes stop_codon:yes gene_type:complete